MIELSLLLQVLLWVLLCVLFLGSSQASLFHPITWYLVFHGLVFVIRPTLVHFAEFERLWLYMGFFPDQTQFLHTLLVSSFGLVVFFGFCLYSGWERNDYQSMTMPQRLSVLALDPMATSTLKLVFVLLGSFGLFSAIYTIGGANLHGEGNVQMTIVDGHAIFTNTTAYFAHARNLLGPLSLLFIIFARFRWWSYWPLLLYAFYRTYMGHARWTLVVILLSLLLLFLWIHGRKWLKIKTLVFFLPILLLWFSVLGDYRYALKNTILGYEMTEKWLEQRTWAEKLDTADFANFDYLAYVVSVVPEETYTFTYGTQYLKLLTEPIPRILWKDKPVGSPIQFFSLNEYGNFAGRTVSLVGDGWMSGGWFGVFITVAIVGFLLGRFHRWFWQNQDNVFRVLLYILALPLTIQLYRDGNISIFKFMLFTLFPVWVWWFFYKMSKKPLAREAKSV